MPTLVVRNLPEDLHRALKRQARQCERSMNGQAIVLLRRALSEQGDALCEEVAPPYAADKPLTQALLNEAKKERP